MYVLREDNNLLSEKTDAYSIEFRCKNCFSEDFFESNKRKNESTKTRLSKYVKLTYVFESGSRKTFVVNLKKYVILLFKKFIIYVIF